MTFSQCADSIKHGAIRACACGTGSSGSCLYPGIKDFAGGRSSPKVLSNLRGKRGQAFADCIRSIPSEQILYVSLDVSKYFHVAKTEIVKCNSTRGVSVALWSEKRWKLRPTTIGPTNPFGLYVWILLGWCFRMLQAQFQLCPFQSPFVEQQGPFILEITKFLSTPNSAFLITAMHKGTYKIYWAIVFDSRWGWEMKIGDSHQFPLHWKATLILFLRI